MKRTKQLTCLIAAFFQLLSLSGCSGWKGPLVANELRFSLDGITEVDITYDDEAVTFFVSENEEFIIREYMTSYQKSYCARVKQDTHHIRIREGSKPLWKNDFSRHIEVYLPETYAEDLAVATTDGDIDLSGIPLSVSKLCVNSTAGTVRLDSVTADEIDLTTTKGNLSLGNIQGGRIQIKTTSGSVSIDRISGQVIYTTTNGNLEIRDAAGSGDYTAHNSGKLNVVYTAVNGDLFFYNKNDDIELTVPADLEFIFDAETKNGAVIADFLTDSAAGRQAIRETVGDDPKAAIQVESRNGDIRIVR